MSPDTPKSKHADGKLYVGPAGWSYDDWNGVVYPEKRPKNFHPLNLLARWFNMVEINSSFYRIPPAKNADSWNRRVRDFPDFIFTAKLWQGFTHDRQYTKSDVSAFRQFAEALAAGERLGCLLMQFPWSFKNSGESLQYLDSLYDAFKAFPLCLEVRHDSWLHDDAILDFCRERSIAFCNIDQPVLMHCIAPSAHVTAPFAYVRLHGRNIENWFNDKADATTRYDYLYKYDELNEWARRMRQLLNQCARVYAVTNNHARGQAVANGIELRSALEPQQIRVPASLAREYPQLLKSPGVQPEDDEEQQLELF